MAITSGAAAPAAAPPAERHHPPPGRAPCGPPATSAGGPVGRATGRPVRGPVDAGMHSCSCVSAGAAPGRARECDALLCPARTWPASAAPPWVRQSPPGACTGGRAKTKHPADGRSHQSGAQAKRQRQGHAAAPGPPGRRSFGATPRAPYSGVAPGRTRRPAPRRPDGETGRHPRRGAAPARGRGHRSPPVSVSPCRAESARGEGRPCAASVAK